MRDRRHFFNETHAHSNWHATYHHNHYHNLHHEDHNHRHYGRHALLYPPTPEPGNGAFRSHDTGATSTDETDNSKRHAQDGSESTSYIDILHEDAKVSLVSRFELRLASAIALVNKELQRVAGVAMPIIIRRMHDDTMRGIMIEWLEAPADTHAMYQLVKYIAGRDKIRLRHIILSYYMNLDVVNPVIDVPVEDMIQQLKRVEVVDNNVTNLTKLNFLACTVFNAERTLEEKLQMQPVRTLQIHHSLPENVENNNKRKATPSLYVLILKRLMSRNMFNNLKIIFTI